ncbi:Ku protein [Streptomyces sp. NPDC021056]|uniref:Ku protein n=1 Tax=Streptomyces sp. NPDC021056 TaxID=3155012 RepID=UPI0033C48C6A
MLVQALARRSQVAIVKFAVRGDRERLGMLRPRHDALVLNALRWSDEIRPPADRRPLPYRLSWTSSGSGRHPDSGDERVRPQAVGAGSAGNPSADRRGRLVRRRNPGPVVATGQDGCA